MDNLNPHQFGDQLTLFHAPLGQPESGTFKGNPHARLFRAMVVPEHVDTPEAVLKYASQKGTDRGHDRSLGIHWQHDLDQAEDHEAHWSGDEHDTRRVILEADHPGHEHVIDDTPNLTYQNIRGKQMLAHAGPPEGLQETGLSSRRNRLTGYKKDWALIHDTVGPHNMNSTMLAEVPVRPGAPMTVHAVHFPDPSKSGDYIRVPVKRKGQA